MSFARHKVPETAAYGRTATVAKSDVECRLLKTRAIFGNAMCLDLGIVILSLFCAGGLVAYVREILRLQRLKSSGTTAVATIIDVEEISGSESVVHYLVKYEFMDAEGRSTVHEQDLNSKRFFDTLKRGDTINVLYGPGRNRNSYPVSQINSDIKLSGLIAAAIIIFWAVMATYLTLG